MRNRKGVLPPQEAREVSRSGINAMRLLALGLMAVLFWPQPADAAAWLTGWTYRKTITIHFGQVGTVNNTDQSNFPVLINLASDSGLQVHARSDGFDILFTSSDGVTKIPYEREQYASGTLVAWVKVATLSHTVDTVLYLYYGNSGATDQQDTTHAVWDANHKGVWHLKEATGALSADSTTNGNTGTPANSPTQTTGQMDGGLNFNGSNMEDNVSSTFGLGTVSVTMEAWVNLATTSLHGAYIKIGGTSPNQGYALGVGGAGSNNFYFDNPGNLFALLYEGARWITTGHSFGTGWHHAVVVIDGAGHPIAYLDGIAVYSDAIGVPLAPQSSITHIGGYTGSGGEQRHFPGIVDEVRISNSVRSADWIKTEYNNQSSPGTFYSVGSETLVPRKGQTIIGMLRIAQ